MNLGHFFLGILGWVLCFIFWIIYLNCFETKYFILITFNVIMYICVVNYLYRKLIGWPPYKKKEIKNPHHIKKREKILFLSKEAINKIFRGSTNGTIVYYCKVKNEKRFKEKKKLKISKLKKIANKGAEKYLNYLLRIMEG